MWKDPPLEKSKGAETVITTKGEKNGNQQSSGSNNH